MVHSHGRYLTSLLYFESSPPRGGRLWGGTRATSQASWEVASVLGLSTLPAISRLLILG